MKKWIYLLVPGVLLGLFLIVFFSYQKDLAAREAQQAANLNAKMAAEKKQKDEAEAKAREEATKRQKEREEEDAKKEAARLAKDAAIDKEIKDATDSAVAEGNTYQKDINAKELELANLRKQKEQLGLEAFDLAKKVELAKVAKRNAELEEQRLTAMIAEKAAASALAKLPPAPVAAPSR